MHESPPNELEQAKDITLEWCEKIGIPVGKQEFDENGNWIMIPSKVILAMHSEIDFLESEITRIGHNVGRARRAIMNQDMKEARSALSQPIRGIVGTNFDGKKT